MAYLRHNSCLCGPDVPSQIRYHRAKIWSQENSQSQDWKGLLIMELRLGTFKNYPTGEEHVRSYHISNTMHGKTYRLGKLPQRIFWANHQGLVKYEWRARA